MKHKKIIICRRHRFYRQAMARYFGKDNRVVILTRNSVNGHHNRFDQPLVKAAEGYNITYWRRTQCSDQCRIHANAS